MLNKDNEITEVTFDFEGAHLALCHKSQGFSANNKPKALLIKSDEVDLTNEALEAIDKVSGSQDEVQISTSMFDFLRKWFNMYWDEADGLSRILGYTGDGYDGEYINEQIAGIKLLKADKPLEVASQEDINQLTDFIKSKGLQDSFSEGNSEVKDLELEKELDQKPSENKLKLNQGELMSKDVEKLEKALKAQEETLNAKLVAFEKAAKEAEEKALAMEAKVASFEKANLERLEKGYKNKVAEYSFVTEDEVEEFAKTLMALDSEAVVAMLDKAQKAIDAIDAPQGVEGEADLEKSESSSLAEMIAAKYGDNV